MGNKTALEVKWNMVNALLNSVRNAKGVKTVPREHNPYKSTMRESKKAVYKEYIFRPKQGSVQHLMAQSNREAMKLMTIWVRCYGDIYWLKTISGVTVIENSVVESPIM